MNDDILENKSETTRSPKSKTRARCPACSTWISLSDTIEVWDPVTCPECETLLEVIDLRPHTLDYAHDDFDDQDWEDEDWEDNWGSSKKNKKRRK